MMHTQPIMWTAYPKILQMIICPNEEISNHGSHRIDGQNAPYSRGLLWPQMGFFRVSVKISVDFARVSAKWSLRREKGHNYRTYVNNTLLDQTEAVQYFRLRFVSALRTDRMIGRHELSSCISAFLFQEERRDEQIAHLRVPPDDENQLCRNSLFAARGRCRTLRAHDLAAGRYKSRRTWSLTLATDSGTTKAQMTCGIVRKPLDRPWLLTLLHQIRLIPDDLSRLKGLSA
jgi:hypothetical protein